jgi:serine/threonine-protein kinase
VAERSFAGFTYQDRLAVGFFGEVYRGHDESGREARIIHVDAALAGRDPFSRAVLRFGEQRAVLIHPRVVSVRTIGQADERLIVVTEAVTGPVTVADILARAGGRVPRDIALAIAVGLVEGLAHAQSLGVVHGGVHPRSVLVDFHGGARLSDFALAGALAEAAAADDDGDLLAGLRGYVAAELAIGGDASALTDVYAAGALIHELLTGQPPLGGSTLEAPPALAALVARALASDPAARFVNATELEEALEDAVVQDAVRVAPADEVARYVMDLLARGDGERAGSAPPLAAAPRRRGLTALLDEIDEPEETSAVTRERAVDDLTVVDDGWSIAPAAADPIDQILELSAPAGGDDARPDDERTPLPAPSPGGTLSGVRDAASFQAWASSSERSALAAVDALLEGDGEPARPTPAAKPPRAASGPATPVPLPAPALEPRPALEPLPAPALGPHVDGGARGVRGEPSPAPEPEPSGLQRARIAMWSGVILVTGGVLVAVLLTQKDQVADRAHDAAVLDRAQEAALREAQRTHPGELVIESKVAEAAVWLSLGRTPVRSMDLPSNMVHELRLELEGHRPADLAVTAQHWSGAEGARQAVVGATLVPGTATASAYPPAPAEPPVAGPPGRGAIEITSDPPGAEVWLLVGFTPTATVDLEGGRAYAIKATRQGFRPGFAAVKAEDWLLGGPGGELRRSLRREVELEPVAEPTARKRRRGR